MAIPVMKKSIKVTPEALHTTTPATDLEEEADEPEDQREGVVDIVPLIGRHVLGVRIAIPVEEAIDEGNTRSSATTQEPPSP